MLWKRRDLNEPDRRFSRQGAAVLSPRLHTGPAAHYAVGEPAPAIGAPEAQIARRQHCRDLINQTGRVLLPATGPGPADRQPVRAHRHVGIGADVVPQDGAGRAARAIVLRHCPPWSVRRASDNNLPRACRASSGTFELKPRNRWPRVPFGPQMRDAEYYPSKLPAPVDLRARLHLIQR